MYNEFSILFAFILGYFSSLFINYNDTWQIKILIIIIMVLFYVLLLIFGKQ
jgi:hypothetical protein